MAGQTMREQIDAALQAAVDSDDKRRAATLRLVLAAVRDREARAREMGADGLPEADVLDILNKMVYSSAL